MRAIPMFVALCLLPWLAPGCSKSGLTGEATLGGGSRKGSTPGPASEDQKDRDGQPEDGDGGDDGDGRNDGADDRADGNDDDLGADGDSASDDPLSFSDDEVRHEAKSCTTTSLKFAPADGETCPAGYAAFTADDGNSATVGCCQLPTGDILAKLPSVPRGTTCQADEVATGANAQGLLCSKINTKRYKLGPSAESCYVGDGASGGQGAEPCGVPPVTLQALTKGFGSDACIGAPFGSLIVSRTGKYCRDVRGARLLYKESGKPVKMIE